MLSLTPLPLSQAELSDWLLAVAMGELSSLNHFLPKKKKSASGFWYSVWEGQFYFSAKKQITVWYYDNPQDNLESLVKIRSLALRQEGGRDAKEQELLCTKLQSAIWCFWLPGWLLCKSYNLASSQLYPFATCIHAALVIDI